MGETQKKLKTMSGHGFTQFELTQKILNKLQQFKISPIAKLVLLEISACYNPNKADMFPKQKTLAAKIGCSERSVTRAVQELFKAGLILIECKYTNRYKFAPYFLISLGILNENVSDENRNSVIKETDNLSVTCIEQKKETKKEPVKVDDFKILKNYAVRHGAKNVNAYINVLRKNGSADKILQEYKQGEINSRVMSKYAQEQIRQAQENLQTAAPPTEKWKMLIKKLR